MVEVATPGDTSGNLAAIALPVCDATSQGANLWTWESRVSNALEVGLARIVTVPLGTGDLPVGVAIGGWPVAEPCCVGSPAPDSDNIVHERGWYCERCGNTIEPEVWAAMSLERDGSGEWMLPEPTAIAAAADGAVRTVLGRRDLDAAEEATRLMNAAGSGAPRTCRVRFAAPRRKGDGAPPLWCPTALVSRELDEDGEAVTIFGHWGPLTDKPTGDGRSFKMGFRNVGWVALRPAQLNGLLSQGGVLAEAAADRKLDAEQLSRAWSLAAGVAPHWLTTPEAIDELADIGMDRREQAKEVLRESGGLGL